MIQLPSGSPLVVHTGQQQFFDKNQTFQYFIKILSKSSSEI